MAAEYGVYRLRNICLSWFSFPIFRAVYQLPPVTLVDQIAHVGSGSILFVACHIDTLQQRNVIVGIIGFPDGIMIRRGRIHPNERCYS
jgi:hypothetical protein